MKTIDRYDITSFKDPKIENTAIQIPSKLSTAMGRIALDREENGIKGYNKKSQILEALILFLESNMLLSQFSQTDIVGFVREATDLFAILGETYMKAKGIQPNEINWGDVAKWAHKNIKATAKES